MKGAEQGYLLLTSHLGDPNRRPLSQPQLRTLASRVFSDPTQDYSRKVSVRDLTALGYPETEANRILKLLGDEELLAYYVQKGRQLGCVPLTPMGEDYPKELTNRLSWERPGALWAKGDLSLLRLPRIALVGSRDLRGENRAFAEEAGRQAARQGYILVSGNARGADLTAQNACLAAGGKVISVVADALVDKKERENLLYLSEDGFDEGFSAQRALSRNRVIHALGTLTLVAQCTLGTGGTWDGSLRNLKGNWTPLFVYRDGSPAFIELHQRGAEPIGKEELQDISGLACGISSLL